MSDLILRASDPATERITYTLDMTQTWRQVGWIGQTGKVYALGDEEGVRSEPGGFSPLWILAHNEQPVPPEEALSEQEHEHCLHTLPEGTSCCLCDYVAPLP